MANANTDTIEYQILMEATKAVQDLEKLTVQATTADEKMRLVAVAAVDFGEKVGISASNAEAWFKRVEASASQLQRTMSQLSAKGMGMNLGPLEQNLMKVQPIFPDVEGKSTQALVSAEMYKGVDTQIKQIVAEQAQFDTLTKQTTASIQQEAAALNGVKINIKSAADNMASLSAYVNSQKGQGLLQNFLGGYNAATTATQQIGTIKTAMTSLKTETGASLSQIGSMFKATFTTIPTGQVDQAVKELNAQLEQVPEKANRTVHSLDAVRIALGAIVAMIVFQVIQAVSTFFSNAIKDAREFESVLYNVANAEKIMSEQGVNIAPKDFQDMIDKLRQLVPMLSQLDATKAVGNLALFTKDLGYTKDQIGSLADAIGVLYVRNRSLGLSFEQVQSQVQTGLLTGRAQGIRDLGVSISETMIENEALRMGLVKTDAEFKALSGDVQTQVKAQAMLGLIMKSTSEEQKNLGTYMETTDAKMATASAKIKDIGATLGKIYLPVLGLLASYLNVQVQWWGKVINAINNYAAVLGAALTVAVKVAQGQITSVKGMAEAFNTSYKNLYEGFSNIYKLTGDLAGAQDTATGSAQTLTKSLVDMSKVDLSSLSNALQSLQDRLHDLNRDFAQKNANYQDEFNTKLERMQEDYQTSVSQTQQEFANRRADAEAQYRNQQLDAEAKYQEQLRELRTKYLYDLEDALRNRDARQVLRLQAQYKMDKDNLQHNFEIENAARARQYALELSQLRRQEAQKLAELAQAEAIKEARAREDFAREQAQRKQEYQNQLDDLKRSWDEKLTEEAGKIAADQGLNEEGALAIKKILEKYYGPGGVFDGLFQGSLDSLTTNGAAMLAEMAAIIAQYQAMATTIAPIPFGTSPQSPSPMSPESPFYNLTTPYTGTSTQSPSPMSPTSPFYQYAEGGIDFADRPKTVTFGDRGPEFAAFLPAGKSLKDVPNNLPPSMMGGGLNGLIRLALDLSPDLEARIMDNTLKEAAQISTHVYRRRT